MATADIDDGFVTDAPVSPYADTKILGHVTSRCLG
jgi:hypothetical protein